MAIVPTWKAHVNTQLLQHSAVSGILDRRCIEGWAREAGHRWRDSYWSPQVTPITVWMRPTQWLPSCGLSRDAFSELPESLPVWLNHNTNPPARCVSTTAPLHPEPHSYHRQPIADITDYDTSTYE